MVPTVLEVDLMQQWFLPHSESLPHHPWLTNGTNGSAACSACDPYHTACGSTCTATPTQPPLLCTGTSIQPRSFSCYAKAQPHPHNHLCYAQSQSPSHTHNHRQRHINSHSHSHRHRRSHSHHWYAQLPPRSHTYYAKTQPHSHHCYAMWHHAIAGLPVLVHVAYPSVRRVVGDLTVVATNMSVST